MVHITALTLAVAEEKEADMMVVVGLLALCHSSEIRQEHPSVLISAGAALAEVKAADYPSGWGAGVAGGIELSTPWFLQAYAGGFGFRTFPGAETSGGSLLRVGAGPHLPIRTKSTQSATARRDVKTGGGDPLRGYGGASTVATRAAFDRQQLATLSFTGGIAESSGLLVWSDATDLELSLSFSAYVVPLFARHEPEEGTPRHIGTRQLGVSVIPGPAPRVIGRASLSEGLFGAGVDYYLQLSGGHLLMGRIGIQWGHAGDARYIPAPGNGGTIYYRKHRL